MSDQSSLQRLHEHQNQRVDALYHPMKASDPANARSKPSARPRRGVNPRNKFDKLAAARTQHKQERTEYQRQRIHDMQSRQDTDAQMSQQLYELYNGVTIDSLIAEEEELAEARDDEVWSDDDAEFLAMIEQLKLGEEQAPK
ncbi:hypothetical protein DICA3_F34838 [Diutina catenulata]